jgi:hypothetical protein
VKCAGCAALAAALELTQGALGDGPRRRAAAAAGTAMSGAADHVRPLPPPVQLEAVARVLEEGNIKTMSQHSKQTSFLCMYRLKADAPQNAQS